MDRRYYGLKALILAVGIGLAVYSSVFDARPTHSFFAHTHYSAAASVQSAVTQTTIRLSRAIGNLVKRSECYFGPGGM
jgi:hypothetical protein